MYFCYKLLYVEYITYANKLRGLIVDLQSTWWESCVYLTLPFTPTPSLCGFWHSLHFTGFPLLLECVYMSIHVKAGEVLLSWSWSVMKWWTKLKTVQSFLELCFFKETKKAIGTSSRAYSQCIEMVNWQIDNPDYKVNYCNVSKHEGFIKWKLCLSPLCYIYFGN